MQITDVKTVLLTGPSGNDPFLQQQRKLRSAAFIEVHTDTDLVGIGETYTGYHAPELVPEIVNFFKPVLTGVSEQEIEPRQLWQRMYHCGNFWTRTGVGVNVLAGVEGALWDLKGKILGVPVHQLLGGRLHDRLPCYATGCASIYPWSDLIQKFEMYREAGFNSAKVASGWFNAHTGERFKSRSPAAWVDMETEKMEAVRQYIGRDFNVCMDGHMSNVEGEESIVWNVGMARAVLQAMEPYDLFFYEEPLHYNDLEGYAELCASTSVSVAGGECLSTREEFRHYADRRAFDIAQPDAAYIGIAAFLDVARQFAVQGKQVATHAWASGAGVMQNIHAAFATPNVAILEIPPLAGPLHTEIYTDGGYRFQNGYILPPEAPGLGVQLTDATKNRYPFQRDSGEWSTVPGKGSCK
ncbi:MAG: mandelate racemase/muconate lactonizing enzyme family protein [Fuerstiella sp.]|nr:mandelate racemase/muconate lactonizing enzyme family protein [Fuerstiella sp.]